MIWLFNTRSRRMSSYKTFEELCDYFNRLENFRFVVDPYEDCESIENQEKKTDSFENNDHLIDQKCWGFIYHPHHKLLDLLEHLEETNFIQIIQEAYEEELEIIEIFRGEAISEWIVITHDLDEKGIMREWCLDYAYAHGFVVLVTVSEGVACGIQQKKNS